MISLRFFRDGRLSDKNGWWYHPFNLIPMISTVKSPLSHHKILWNHHLSTIKPWLEHHRQITGLAPVGTGYDGYQLGCCWNEPMRTILDTDEANENRPMAGEPIWGQNMVVYGLRWMKYGGLIWLNMDEIWFNMAQYGVTNFNGGLKFKWWYFHDGA